MKSKDDDISPEDRALFRDSVKGAIPLGDKRPTTLPSKKPSKKEPLDKKSSPNKAPIPHQDSWENLPLSDHSSQPVSSEDLLEYSGSGISHKDMRRLKAGDFHVESQLDLHGLTADEARHQLLHFLEKAQSQGWRCIRIVHGKGKHGTDTPILKNLANTWLRQLPQILAFCSAPRRDGGAGAVTVLLKVT